MLDSKIENWGFLNTSQPTSSSPKSTPPIRTLFVKDWITTGREIGTHFSCEKNRCKDVVDILKHLRAHFDAVEAGSTLEYYFSDKIIYAITNETCPTFTTEIGNSGFYKLHCGHSVCRLCVNVMIKNEEMDIVLGDSRKIRDFDTMKLEELVMKMKNAVINNSHLNLKPCPTPDCLGFISESNEASEEPKQCNNRGIRKTLVPKIVQIKTTWPTKRTTSTNIGMNSLKVVKIEVSTKRKPVQIPARRYPITNVGYTENQKNRRVMSGRTSSYPPPSSVHTLQIKRQKETKIWTLCEPRQQCGVCHTTVSSNTIGFTYMLFLLREPPHGWNIPRPRPDQEQYLVDKEEQPVGVKEEIEPDCVLPSRLDEYCIRMSEHPLIYWFQ
ncbi:hypothetical protein GCK72_022440 [Caenorhabditis remanei]|uniref:RING-type domain-containing protein n=1 Tax=Caenorhabditis remanei TaxID=31234 RepID=A0A6A5FTR5_CAERE|nr:hypothetical protein GCK72_022440 [Caenorhabditis remanei]KAF1745990.1 hypothetical protein GCK72_022440 [Caenorhabditis remanei]